MIKSNKDSMETGGTPARVWDYEQAARDLRNSIHYNIQDDRYANEGQGTIRYVLDTNVVRFFLNPTEKLRRVWPFGGTAQNEAGALAIATAEFVMSRQLCGQWSRPAMISLDHAKEMSDWADRTLRRTNEAIAKQDQIEADLRERVAETIEAITGPEAVSASVDNLMKTEPLLRELLSDAGYEAHMFTRLWQQSLLEPLHIDDLATRDVLDPPKADIEQWISLIEQNHQLIERISQESLAKNRKKQDRSINNEADARTAVQIVLLNEAASAVKNERLVRYVFITTDRSFYNAAVDWYNNHGGRKRIGFFPFRRLSQYTPLLNVDDMPNNIRNSRMIEELTKALDSLPGLDGGHEGSYPLILPDQISSPPKGEGTMASMLAPLADRLDRSSAWREAIVPLRESWAKLARNAVFINAGLIAERINAFDGLADLLARSQDLRQVVVGFMQETLEQVERVHMSFNVQFQLLGEIQKAEPIEEGRAVRGIMLLRAPFDSFTGGMPLYRYLNRVVREQDQKELDRLQSKLQKIDGYSAYLFAGCVAFWAGLWPSARRFADLALSRYERDHPGVIDDRLAEVAYFQAVTNRYIAYQAREGFADIEQQLKALLEKMTAIEKIHCNLSDRFLSARANSEMGMIQLGIAYVIGLGEMEESQARPQRQRDGDLAMEAAFEHFKQCEVELSHLRQPGQLERDLLIQLEAETLIGVAGCLLQKFFFGNTLPTPEEEARWTGLQREIRALIQGSDAMVPSIYGVAEQLLAVAFCRDPRKLPDLVRTTQKAMREHATRRPQEVTELDKMAVSTLADALEATAKRRIESTLSR